MKIFLGGTVANNKWRQQVILDLMEAGVKEEDIFNPVCKPGEWNEAFKAKEDEAKRTHYMLFWIADPINVAEPLSAYSLFEAAKALYSGETDRTMVVINYEGMVGHPLKVMKAVEKDLKADFPKNVLPWNEVLDKIVSEYHRPKAIHLQPEENIRNKF